MEYMIVKCTCYKMLLKPVFRYIQGMEVSDICYWLRSFLFFNHNRNAVQFSPIFQRLLTRFSGVIISSLALFNRDFNGIGWCNVSCQCKVLGTVYNCPMAMADISHVK